MHIDQVSDELSDREQALRKLLLPYSLALRLRDAGVAAEVIGVKEAALQSVYRIAKAKLTALPNGSRCSRNEGLDPRPADDDGTGRRAVGAPRGLADCGWEQPRRSPRAAMSNASSRSDKI
jgi:hypothetical protein